jgi:hypothetical protein
MMKTLDEIRSILEAQKPYLLQEYGLTEYEKAEILVERVEFDRF